MNIKTYLLAIGFFLLIYSCKRMNCNENSSADIADTLMPFKTQANDGEDKDIKQIAEENRLDSLRLCKVLDEALVIAKENINAPHFTKEYEITVDSAFNATVNMEIGHLFSDESKYLMIHRIVPWGVFVNIYLIEGNKLSSVLSHEQEGMTYIDDTIRDVNGDGNKDFLVHWYPSSGCCRRDIYNVYLNSGNKKTFESSYEFINPTFSPAEKIIRGIKYGHPGHVGLYKYKWNELKLDTIEYIDPNLEDTISQSYIIRRTPFNSNEKPLKTIPKEYHGIESYDWFLGY